MYLCFYIFNIHVVGYVHVYVRARWVRSMCDFG